jgi:hypothetical protein
MKQLLLILIAIALMAAPSSQKYGELLSYAVCETGVNYEVLMKSDHVSKAAAEFQTVTEVEFDKLNESEQIAWYSNLYNFYTIKLIVEHYPTESIRDLKSPWDQKTIPLWGKKVSLNHIEHKVLREKYSEPRIHFALVCASIGCPSLRTTPFTGANLTVELDEQAKLFLTDRSKNRLEDSTLYLSKIFQWYGDDFNDKYGNYQSFVKFVLAIDKKIKVKFLEYDWNLNKAQCKE